MDATPEILIKIEEYAELLYAPAEIAILIDVDITDFVQQLRENTEIKTAYTRGKLKSETEIRKQAIEAAKEGSDTARQQVLTYLKKMDIAETQHKIYT